jgi:hypothetical protein
MSNFTKVASVSFFIIRKKWHEIISIPAFIEFVVANIGDFLQPKFKIIRYLFLFFTAMIVYCGVLIGRWIQKNNVPVPVTEELVFAEGSGLIKGVPKGLIYALVGFIFTCIFFISQFFVAENNKGLLASLIPELQPVQQTLLGMDAKLSDIDRKLDNVKKETSDDPAKELQNRGVAWSGKNFLEAVKTGEGPTVKLFLQGGMHPETAEADGRSLAVMLSLNSFNPGEILDILVKNGLDINDSYDQFSPGSGGKMKTTLLEKAIEKGNRKLVAALIEKQVKTDEPVQTFGPMGIGIMEYPLQSAIYWKQAEIVQILLDSKADISAGDYAAYREMFGDQDNYYWKQHTDEVHAFLQKMAPPASEKSDRVNAELHIRQIDAELNETALKSLQSDYSTKKKYDLKYDSLQAEKKKLQEEMKSRQ